MTQHDNSEDVLVKYVQLRTQLRALEEEVAAIYPQAVQAMKELGETRTVGDARLVYRTRNTYKFTNKIDQLAEDLKLLKRHEIDSGVAKVASVTELIYLKFME